MEDKKIMEAKLTALIKEAAALKGMRGNVMIKEVEMMAVAIAVMANSEAIEKLSKLTEINTEIQKSILEELKKLNNKPIEKVNVKPIDYQVGSTSAIKKNNK